MRLDRLRESEDCRAVLAELDSHILLDAEVGASSAKEEDLDDEALLSSLGVSGINASSEGDITKLTHVRSQKEIKAAEEVAQERLAKPLIDSNLSSRAYRPI